jgi:hypothetical protein
LQYRHGEPALVKIPCRAPSGESAFGKEGALRGREFGDQIHTFSCLSVLHNAVVAWNTLHIGPVVEQLRAEGHTINERHLEPGLHLSTTEAH